VYVTNLPYNALLQDIRDFFSSIVGSDVDAEIILDSRGRSAGAARLILSDVDAVGPALASSGQFFQGRKFGVQNRPVEGDKLRAVFVSNLPIETTSRTLEGIFKPCGEIAEVVIVTNHRGAPMRRAVIEFLQEEGATEALRLHHVARIGSCTLGVVRSKVSAAKARAGNAKRFASGRPSGPPEQVEEKVRRDGRTGTGRKARIGLDGAGSLLFRPRAVRAAGTAATAKPKTQADFAAMFAD